MTMPASLHSKTLSQGGWREVDREKEGGGVKYRAKERNVLVCSRGMENETGV